MTSLDPGCLSLSDWQADSICRDLAALIADQAVENAAAIPERLLAAYHDALQLRATIKELVKYANDAALREVNA